MRNRSQALLFLLAVVALTAVVAHVLRQPAGPISSRDCDRIEIGMTLPQVEAILGGPPGAYTVAESDWSWVLENGVMPSDHTRRVWVSDVGGVRIDFDPAGRVAMKQWVPGPAANRGLLQRLFRR